MSITTDDNVLHGMPHLARTRISVLHIYDMVVRGDSNPAAVADALEISLGQVYAGLAYYCDHPAEMRHHRAEVAAARDELADRVVEPPAAADAAGE